MKTCMRFVNEALVGSQNNTSYAKFGKGTIFNHSYAIFDIELKGMCNLRMSIVNVVNCK